MKEFVLIDPYTIIAAVALVLLLILLYGEKRESIAWKLASKPLLSALFIVTALLQLDSLPLAWWILGGLAFSWLGDVCLIFSQRKMFLFGLVAFLLGHMSYAIGFYASGSLELRSLAGLAAMLALGVGIFLWLRPHLGRMTGPVIAYIVVISVMVGGAAAMYTAPQWAAAGRRTLLLGAILFFTSDIFVARNKFVADGFINRLLGLPLYYGGQFLLALSIGWL
ncbi:MAG: lysoplasmalogenase [Spirochaetota bacterium]